MNTALSVFLHQLQRLNRASHPKLGKAPHKPVLLLSVLQLVRDRIIDRNRILISPEFTLLLCSRKREH